MSSNPLNDLSKVYIDQIANVRKAETEADIQRWEEIGGPTPTNYKPTGNSAKIKTEEKIFKSNWRVELNDDYQGDPSASIPVFPGGEKQAAKKVKDVKGIKNKIEINPKLPEAVEQMGGELIEATEVDPIILSAVEYFYEEGINEEGLELLIEEIGLEAFVDFVEGGAVELNEARDARRATVRAKKYDVVKKEVDKADAARKASKKGEYAPSYAKKETDVTDYGDDKPAAKKAPAKKPDPKPVEKKATPKPVVKKVERAVEKVKPAQPKKPASKEGLRDKIKSAYKAGVKRHRKATQPVRVFHKGMKAGAKKTVKFAKDVKKAVVGERYDPMDDPDFDHDEAEKNRGVSGKNNPKGGKKLKDILKNGKNVKEGKIADALKKTIADMKSADRKAGLLPGGKDVVDLDVERERRRKKKVEEEVGISSSVAMEKARKEAELRRKEEQAVKKEKKALKKEEVQLEDRSTFKKAMSRVFGKKKEEERKPQKAQDAGARLRRQKARQEYADKVSGSVDLVPDDLRDHYEIAELNRYGKETGKATGSLNKRPGSPVRRGGDEPGALRNVRAMIRKETGKPEGQKRRDYDERHSAQNRRESPVSTVTKRRERKARADAAMRDTRGT